MRFSNPEALFLLVLLIPFSFLVIYNYNKKKKILERFMSNFAYGKLGVRSGREIDFFKASLVILAIVFFVLALAGPEWGDVFENLDVKGIEMMFLLDTSNSMNAEDLKPNRLVVAKQLMVGLVDNFVTDYVGLINFAGVPYVQCPLTIDYDAFKLMVDASVVSPDEEQGTDFSAAFALALRSFRSAEGDGANRIVILITDGEDQEQGWRTAMEEFQKQKVIVFAVGVGVRSGAPIPVKNAEGDVTGWKKDRQGNIVKTRLDEETLIQVASTTGGQYFRLTDSASIDTFIQGLQSFERKVLSQKVRMKKQKRFYYPLIIGIILLLIEMCLTEKRLKWKTN